MKSFKDYMLDKYNLKMPEGTISGAWFADNNIPIIVECCCCQMTMASPSAWIDEEGFVYCGQCADMET